MNSHALLFLFILFSATISGEGATAAYKPTEVFLFNCGVTSDNVDNSGRTWTADSLKSLSSDSDNASFTLDATYQEAGVPLPLVPYMIARIFKSASTYKFPLSPGWKFIRLYFYPTQYGPRFNATDSLFTVNVNGYTLLKNFSAYLTAKASIPVSEALIKEFIVPVNQNLNLTFTPSPGSLAFINGIEIISMPDRFYSKGGFDDKIINVANSNVDFKIANSTALETVYRLNVGGEPILDSEMFRQWLSDDEIVLSKAAGIKPTVPDVIIKYTEKTPAYVAPKDLYTSCRSMGNPKNPQLNNNFNLTWLFPVDSGFNYLIRLHFCEILPDVTEPGQRVFTTFIQNQTAKLYTDVIYLSGGSKMPVYLDFVIFVPGTSQRRDIRLDLHPYIDYYDAFLNGVEVLKLNGSQGNLAGPNPNPPISREVILNPATGKPQDSVSRHVSHVLVITLAMVGSAIGLVIFIMFFFCQMKRKKNMKDESVFMSNVLLKRYTYAQVKRITKSFSHTLGKGGFGTVYGGKLSSGRKVAVKILKDSKGNGEDFVNEISSISQTSHVNIVSLLGFCYEGSKRAIIYEFLENGSLDQLLLSPLDVTTLYGIALGIAHGLEYLHYGCKTRIVHFDIKPQNILLDSNLCPKVSDFGLAKLCEKRESIVSLIDTRGTIGYIAPEVFSGMFGRISHKSDVYSYGMLVLEMIGARNKDTVETTTSNPSTSYFPDWIYKGLENEEHIWILGDEVTEENKEIAKKMVLVALWCIQPRPADRPSMNRVTEMMEGSLDALQVPPKPSSIHVSLELATESSSLSYGLDEAA